MQALSTNLDNKKENNQKTTLLPLKSTLINPKEVKEKKNKSVNFNLDLPDNKYSSNKSTPVSPLSSVNKSKHSLLVDDGKISQLETIEKQLKVIKSDESKKVDKKEAIQTKEITETITKNDLSIGDKKKIHHKKEIPSFPSTTIPSDVTVLKLNNNQKDILKSDETISKSNNENVHQQEMETLKMKKKKKADKDLIITKLDVDSKTNEAKLKIPKNKINEKGEKMKEDKKKTSIEKCLLIKEQLITESAQQQQQLITKTKPKLMQKEEKLEPSKSITTTKLNEKNNNNNLKSTPTKYETLVITSEVANVSSLSNNNVQLFDVQELTSRSKETETKIKKKKKVSSGKGNEMIEKVKKKKVKKALTEDLISAVNVIESNEIDEIAVEKKKSREKLLNEKKDNNNNNILKGADESISPVKPKKKQKIRFREYTIDDFVLLTVLGRGSFGKVLLAELRDHGVYFAIKCLKKHTVIEDDDVESIMIERKVLALGSNNPFICKLFATFQDETTLFFTMEWCAGGDLMFHVQKDGKFNEERARFYASEMMCALWFMHKRGIIYRDLKLDNVMIYQDGHIRLVDFGMCQGKIYREELLPSNFCGTPEYMAPEIIKGVKYNHSVDYWALGVVIYEMIVGTSPFQGTDEDELLWNVCNQEVHYPRFLSTNVKNLIILLLKKEPKERLGVTMNYGHIKDQPWFEGINWSLAEQAKLHPPFVPQLICETDVSYFDQYFTREEPIVSTNAKPIEDKDQELFNGFNYTNPNMTE